MKIKCLEKQIKERTKNYGRNCAIALVQEKCIFSGLTLKSELNPELIYKCFLSLERYLREIDHKLEMFSSVYPDLAKRFGIYKAKTILPIKKGKKVWKKI